MSEQKLTYMQQLDGWTDSNVIMPLANPNPEGDFDLVVEDVRKAIREKVLESYKNGLAAGRKSAPARKEQHYAQAKTR